MNKSVLYTVRSAILFFLCMCISLFACAHQIRMSVYLEGNLVEGEIYFVGGGSPPASGAKIDLIKGEEVLHSIVADESGWFSFGSITPDTYTVRGDGGQGHVAFYDLNKSEFIENESGSQDVTSSSAPQNRISGENQCSSSLSQQDLQIAITKAIRPLREKIDRYEAKTRMHDILGGIGYILGLFGLLIIFRNRKVAGKV